ncbi:MAG: YciI family protein [Microbacteriaceae bacterium]|nr:YciI family protein [Microbacteriaceae bacterium]MCL2795704.1 YciI family protein [Microbacteriaceae bacterium]
MTTYMLIMRTADEAAANQAIAEAGLDFEKMIETMGRYNEELLAAGVLVSCEGLDDPSTGAVVDFGSTPPVVTDGPYGETKELFNGYWIVDVADKAEAVAWASKAPLGPGVQIEIRRVPSIDEFPLDNEYIVREKQWRTDLLRRQADKAEGK